MADNSKLAAELLAISGEGSYVKLAPSVAAKFAPLIEAGLARSGPGDAEGVPFALTAEGLALAAES